ncbi:MAG: hypothetical protein GC138_07885 [Gammaproteobacteria bacterium]|nr:hypothetical protein [Gammaproteobacteria bacterium]
MKHICHAKVVNGILRHLCSGSCKSRTTTRYLSYAAILIVAVSLGACSSMPTGKAPAEAVALSPHKTDLSDAKATKEKLYSQYRQWKGTPYAYGGLSKKGIDCSGFAYATFSEKFGIKIPRTTQLQSHAGKQVKRSEIRPGDLVFFKTGAKVRHVGIYPGNHKFVHASTMKGVMISDMRDAYWKDSYWQTRRIGL